MGILTQRQMFLFQKRIVESVYLSMIKISENVVLKTLDENTLLAIQSIGAYDYREKIEAKSKDIYICVSTADFLVIKSEGIVRVESDNSTATFYTEDGEYKLPIFRERGILAMSPVVNLPDSGPKMEWTFNFSGKSINTLATLNSISQASQKIVLGKNLLARAINNVLEMYGDISSEAVSIGPKEYSLIQSLGEATLRTWDSGELQAYNDTCEVRVRKVYPKLALEGVEKKMVTGGEVCQVDFSKVKLKTVQKFILDSVQIEFKTGRVSIIGSSMRKTLEFPDLIIKEPFSIKVMSSDLKYLTGKIRVLCIGNKGVRKMYSLISTDKDKTVFILVIGEEQNEF